MSKKSEDTSSVSPMATAVDPSIRAILDAMQKQNEIKLRKLLKETIKAATSRSYQGSLVSHNLNKSLEKTDVTVGNEEMVLKEFSKELQSNVENSYEKKVSIDTASQDYIFIKTDLMFDVNSSTEYQKESVKRRKEDIAVLYNDLSPSSSQDTQNLQEWFDKKSKSLGEAEKDHNKKDNISMRNILDGDTNKENQIETKELEAVSKSTAENDTKSIDNVEQNISLESIQKARDNAYNNEHLLIEEDQMMTAKNACDTTESKTSADLMSRNLDANTQEKSLEIKDDKNPSPSMLDSNSENETTDTRQRREVLLTNTASDSDRYKSVENDNAVTGVIATDEAKHRGRPRRSDKVEVKKDEDTRKILQNEKGGLEEQRKLEEDTKEETTETEVNSKGILNNKCDLLDTERAIEINDMVQDMKFTEGRSRTQNDMEDVVEDSQELSNKTIEDLHQMLKHQSEIHKVTLNEASLKIGELSDKIKCFKGKDSQIPKRNELLEEEQNKWRSLEKMITEKLEEEKSRAHDPKLNNKIKGFVTEKLERFHDDKSIACAECSVLMCTKNASNVTITFRTPQAPRKHNQDQTRSSSKVKLRELITANDQKLNYDPEHQLADLQVECSDKDRTTQEFEKHTEDMKEEVQKLELQLDERNNISHEYEVDLLEQKKRPNLIHFLVIQWRNVKLELKMQKRKNVVLEPQGQIICPSMKKKHQEELGDIIKLHDEEKYKLIQHWCSVECQTAIKGYIDGKV
ncbi:reticulocyte-binding protein 2 homolog a-like, partial [Bombus vosnesenskii]|uniref:Reticulocyte-binding protein 2 homolog a-like n=1 Tax=Bombus vosnesenskii TaxID=207650 RepID=A0A6J3L771_9HYME